MAHYVTPSQRADQFPDDLQVKGDNLWCIWCDRQIGYKRKDSIIEHLKSKIHNESKKAGKSASRNTTLDCNLDSRSEVRDDKSLRKLFEDSDSDSAASFEGFDSPTIRQHPGSNTQSNFDVDGDESRRSGRQRKRPARLSEDFGDISGVPDQTAAMSVFAKRRRTDSESSPGSSPPARMRCMPIKKQISFTARTSDSSPPSSPVKKTPLKMKLSRKTGKQADPSSDKSVKVISKPTTGKGLKLKFIWKKKQSSKSSDSNESSRETTEISQTESDYDDISQGIDDSLDEEEKHNSLDGIVKEEVVDMEEGAVLSRAGSNLDMPTGKLMSGTLSRPDNALQSRTTSSEGIKKLDKVTEEPTPKKPKLKRVPVPNDDKKRKVTAYMIWSKQMREKISKRFPGLEFGDVSKKLGDMWKKMPEKAKEMWKVKNKAIQQEESNNSTATIRKVGSKMIETGPRKPLPQTKNINNGPVAPTLPDPETVMARELDRLPPPSIEPLDSAAYLSLLGESFSTLSMKAQMGSQTIQGADAVLLDSLVCAMVPLISLLRQIPELKDCVDHSTLRNCFSNIAHIVPGL